MILGCAIAARAWLNYPPDNRTVKVNQTNLPIVFINIDGQVLDRYDRITGRMKIIDNGEGQLNYGDTIAHPGQRVDYEGFIGIRYRGNTSFTAADKKPYSFRPLDRPLEEGGQKVKVSIMGMPADNDWALMSAYADKTLMRDLLAYRLARNYLPYAPDGRFCEVFIDGIYYGVFIMSERNTKGKYRLNLPDPGNSGNALTGGYMLEVDRNDSPFFESAYRPQYNDGRTCWNGQTISFVYKSPDYEDMNSQQVSYIQQQVAKMEDALAAANFDDPSGGFRRYIDEWSFIDCMISTEFSHNVDGYRLSSGFFKWRDSVDPRFHATIWDLNLGFGNANYHGGSATNTWIYNNNDVLIASHENNLIPFWWKRLMEDDLYVRHLAMRWRTCRQGYYSNEHIEFMIDSMANVLNVEGAQGRNYTAWPRLDRYVWPNNFVGYTYAAEINYLKNWINDRLAFMDSQLLPLLPKKGDNNLDEVVDVGDLNRQMNVVLGLSNVPDYDIDLYDLNLDGYVDITDLNIEINILLGVDP